MTNHDRTARCDNCDWIGKESGLRESVDGGEKDTCPTCGSKEIWLEVITPKWIPRK